MDEGSPQYSLTGSEAYGPVRIVMAGVDGFTFRKY
jgi:hypothetical protein